MGREQVPGWYPDRLAGLGAPLWILGGCLFLVRFGHSGQASTLALCLVVWSSMWLPYLLRSRAHWTRGRFRARTVLIWALLFRIVLLFAGLPVDTPSTTWAALRDDLGGEVAGYQPFLLWDNDVWRYLWDGHLAAAGLRPYRTTPQQVLDASDSGAPWAEELVEQGPWLDVLDAVSYRDHPSVYPPLAVGLFRIAHAIAPGSVFVWKLQLVMLEWSGCVLFLLVLRASKRHDGSLVWLAWNPLLLKEVAGSGHLEGALVPLLVAVLFGVATRRWVWAGLALAAATLLKLWPLLLAPALLLRAGPRAWWAYGFGVGAGLLPWCVDLGALLDALRSFAGTWVFNPGAWLLFEAAAQALGAGPHAGVWARAAHLGLTALTVVLLLALRMRQGGSTRAGRAPATQDEALEGVNGDWLIILAAYLLLAPTVMPWYLTVALPMAALTRFWPWHLVTIASVLSYLIYVRQEEDLVVLFVEHSAIAVALLIWAWRRRHTTESTSAPSE